MKARHKPPPQLLARHDLNASLEAGRSIPTPPLFGYWINSVVPMCGKGELMEKLKGQTLDAVPEICKNHAIERAEEMCLVYNDEDLCHRDGCYVWCLFSSEIYDALKDTFPSKHWRKLYGLMKDAELAFVRTVDEIRLRRKIVEAIAS